MPGRSPRGWSPVGVGLAVAAVALLFVIGRLLVAADGDISRFVVVGSDFATADLDEAVHVFPSSGYDGQFYWRLAVDPADHDMGATHGLRMDQEVRFGRIGYPMLAWLLAFGRPTLVVWSLVAVNVVGLGFVAGLSGAFARDHDLSPWYGALVAGSSGLVMTLSRDLCEIVMVAGLVLAALAVGRRRPMLAALGFTLAALTHEQSLGIVLAAALWRFAVVVRTTRRPARDDLAWAVPLVAYASWQIVCRVAWGRAPVLQSGDKNLDLPLVGLVRLAGRWLRGDIAAQEVLAPAQLGLLVAVAVLGLRSTAARDEDRWLRVAVAVGAAMAVSVSYNVLKGPAELRTLVIVPTLAWLAVFAARRRPPTWLVGAAGVVVIATMGLRTVAI